LHLSALLSEGFVARRKRGTSSIYRIADPAVLDLCDNVCAAIESQLAQLGAVLSG
jgi:DNA-binding transcriptional ArsR family regulator